MHLGNTGICLVIEEDHTAAMFPGYTGSPLVSEDDQTKAICPRCTLVVHW